jgi:hypothetical protein
LGCIHLTKVQGPDILQGLGGYLKILNISSSGCLKMFKSKEIEVFGFFKKPRRMGGSHEITREEPEVLRSLFDRFLEVLRIATIH